MSSEQNSHDDRDSNFSFGVREMRQAKAAQALSIDTGTLKVVNEDRGSDPYNTSGSFDRNKNWLRVSKR
jgi:hypothetical protein